MALIKLTGLIGDLRGKVGGSVFAQTASGLILKNRVTPVNKNTEKQSLLRGFAFLLQQEWLELSTQQRQCWKTWTSLNPIKQRNNTGLLINAQQTFIKLNMYQLLYGFDVIRDPVFNKTIISPITASLSLIGPDLTLTTSRSMNDSTEFIVLFLTVRVPLTRNNPGTLFKAIIFTTTGTDTFDVSDPYKDIFGRVPVSGEKLFMKLTTADKFTGRVLPFQRKSVIL